MDAKEDSCAVAEIKTTPVEEVMDGRRSWVIATVLTYLAWQVIASHKEHKIQKSQIRSSPPPKSICEAVGLERGQI
uniref:(California timema) hypothetical protein n=1 Tax=Timema californicum TaxID=61474 RepID=A0A7R9J0H6_TIMCA|nr:unnamed protein product [Timema californicum]